MGELKSEKGGIIGQVVSVKDFIDYQNGSVVSREVMNKETGTVPCFLLIKGKA